MPESRHKYLYERLGDHDFQQMVSALLVRQFPKYTAMPLRQNDGGRDGILKTAPNRVLVYQVKWFAEGRDKDPVATLDAMVRAEEKNIIRLAGDGVRHYVLVTNLPSTGAARVGTFDQISRKLQDHARRYGFDEMSCVWRETLNGWVDNASTGFKWTYAEMLAGWDLVRYLATEQVGQAKHEGIRSLIRKVSATQWGEDEVVKFSQSDVDRKKVVDLFVDVTADVMGPTGSPRSRFRPLEVTNGIAQHLLRHSSPFVIIRGAPGQGKSTLCQYLCQAHRASFMPEGSRPPALAKPEDPRFPLRLDLSDYARWLGGADIWGNESYGWRRNRPVGTEASIENFIADFLTYASGGVKMNAEFVHDLFGRVPCLVVLDGLDEVGGLETRTSVVAAIEQFVRRCGDYECPPMVIVTTRPSGGKLPEPSDEIFEVLVLNPLSAGQRKNYIGKWCAVRGIRGTSESSLFARFEEKSRERYVDELAGNPMQLTILLDLLHEQGDATPTQRTDLYDHYVDLLLARESNKHPETVRKHRGALLEIVPFIGWYLQAHAEEDHINNRMDVAELQAAMRHFQRTYRGDESIVSDLFYAASDRLWALTSKTEGIYEFEVQSLREYFAARFLYRNAGEGDPEFDRTTVFRELLRRPYWLNTVRFYGGNARGSDIYILAAGLNQELKSLERNQAAFAEATAPAIIAGWTLLTDGVFNARPAEARAVLSTICSDSGIAALIQSLDEREIVPLPELPRLDASEGIDPTWQRLTDAIIGSPSAKVNMIRVRALRELLNQRTRFSSWWFGQIIRAAGTPTQDAWLRLAADCEAAAGVPLDPADLVFGEGTAQLFLNTGAVPPPGGALEEVLLAAVLDGQCSDTTSAQSLPAQVATALAPQAFLIPVVNGEAREAIEMRRSYALGCLHATDAPIAQAAWQAGTMEGGDGSTSRWALAATAVFEAAGRCWLASEIALIGAASRNFLLPQPHLDHPAFGPKSHPAALLAETRLHATDAVWWRTQLGLTSDDLSRAEWALALWVVGGEVAINSLLHEWEAVVNQLSVTRRNVFLRSAERIGRTGWLGRRQFVAGYGGTIAASLLTRRTALPSSWNFEVRPSQRTTYSEPPLLQTARAGGWLKVDSGPSYR